MKMNVLSAFAIHGHHSGSAKTDVVLKSDFSPFDLTDPRRSAKLPDQLGALGKTGGPQGMPFGEQAAGRIGDHFPAIGVQAVIDELFGGAFGGGRRGLADDAGQPGRAMAAGGP